jgi:hypothetical protein
MIYPHVLIKGALASAVPLVDFDVVWISRYAATARRISALRVLLF